MADVAVAHCVHVRLAAFLDVRIDRLSDWCRSLCSSRLARGVVALLIRGRSLLLGRLRVLLLCLVGSLLLCCFLAALLTLWRRCDDRRTRQQARENNRGQSHHPSPFHGHLPTHLSGI